MRGTCTKFRSPTTSQLREAGLIKWASLPWRLVKYGLELTGAAREVLAAAGCLRMTSAGGRVIARCIDHRWDNVPGMSKKNSITDLTRRNIFDYMTMERVAWAGRLEETQFVVRVWPKAAERASYDTRYKDALGDIHQHRINNYDWDDDWIFGDARFNLALSWWSDES